MATKGDLIFVRDDDSNWPDEIHSVNDDGTVNVNLHGHPGIGGQRIITGGMRNLKPAQNDGDKKINGHWWPR